MDFSGKARLYAGGGIEPFQPSGWRLDRTKDCGGTQDPAMGALGAPCGKLCDASRRSFLGARGIEEYALDEALAIVEKWRSQSRKGFLDLCVLALLERGGRSYGLDMMESLRASGLEVSEGTLYPLLARMTREGSLEASWTAPETGHPRKYYSLSARGAEALASMKAEFDEEIAAYRRLGEEKQR